MPKEMEMKLKKRAKMMKKKGMLKGKDAENAYVYGTMQKLQKLHMG